MPARSEYFKRAKISEGEVKDLYDELAAANARADTAEAALKAGHAGEVTELFSRLTAENDKLRIDVVTARGKAFGEIAEIARTIANQNGMTESTLAHALRIFDETVIFEAFAEGYLIGSVDAGDIPLLTARDAWPISDTFKNLQARISG